MKIEEIRKEFFKLKNKGFSYSQCRRILKGKLEYDVTIRTLKRWIKRLDEGNWNLCDKSRRPHTIHMKVNRSVEERVLSLRQRTGWGSDKLVLYLPRLGISARSIDKILNKHKLCRENYNKGKQKKWIRWQRKHPNSLWQIDHTDEMDKGNCYTLSVIDDCSRYSLAIVKLNLVSTDIITHILDKLMRTLQQSTNSVIFQTQFVV